MFLCDKKHIPTRNFQISDSALEDSANHLPDSQNHYQMEQIWTKSLDKDKITYFPELLQPWDLSLDEYHRHTDATLWIRFFSTFMDQFILALSLRRTWKRWKKPWIHSIIIQCHMRSNSQVINIFKICVVNFDSLYSLQKVPPVKLQGKLIRRSRPARRGWWHPRLPLHLRRPGSS